jgi:4-cresol dehydrogenase (hydroxylating)
VVVDLKRMNRVLEVNEKLHYALVEPGCSFFDLHRHLQSKGIKLYASVPAPGWGSPVGNSLDHGTGHPVRDNFKNHCGMEVVLPNGEVLRTGMGALPNAETWQTYHYGFGPYIDGIFTQSNFGIVTKMGFNLFREPELTHIMLVTSRNYDDLDQLVELAEYMESSGIAPGRADCLSPLMSSREPDVMALIQSLGGGSAQQWNQLSREKNLDIYSVGLRFSGAPRVVEAQIETAKEHFSAIKGIEFRDGKTWRAPLDLDKIDEPDKIDFGIPTLYNFYSDMALNKDPDWWGHVWFSPNIPQTGEALRKANRVFQEDLQKLDMYWGWKGGVVFFPKNYTLLFAFEAGADPETNRKSREGFTRVVQIAAENGWSEYRCPPAFYDLVMGVFSFNNHALLRFHETVKDAIDPNGIISPGRYGIWPKHLREERA